MSTQFIFIGKNFGKSRFDASSRVIYINLIDDLTFEAILIFIRQFVAVNYKALL